MTDVRIERAHRYEFWVPNAPGPKGVVWVDSMDDRDSDIVQIDSVYTDDGGTYNDDMQLPVQAIPALILALTSYQQRLGEAENEDA